MLLAGLTSQPAVPLQSGGWLFEKVLMLVLGTNLRMFLKDGHMAATKAKKTAKKPAAKKPRKPPAPKHPPIHQWTHDGNKVLLVKCVNKDGTSHGDFQWPDSGPVESSNWDGKPTCDGGGLFGWPWGLHLGIGKRPDFTGKWIVFAADPSEIIGEIESEPKAKCKKAEVVFAGSWTDALKFTRAGRIAWTIRNAAGKNSTSGNYSSAATSGDSSSAATSGYYSKCRATGAWSVAVVMGSKSTIEIGAESIGAVTAEEFTWIVHLGAIILHRWARGHATLTTDGLKEGQVVKVIKGKIK